MLASSFAIKSSWSALQSAPHFVFADYVQLLQLQLQRKSWAIKKAKHWRTDAFELWCCRRLLRVPGTARKSIQSILKEINPEYSLEGHAETEAPDAKSWLIEKDPNAGKDKKQEEKGTTEDEIVGWHHQLNGHEFKQVLQDEEGQGRVGCCSP